MITLSSPVFCLTVPKSGTHLLANVLRAMLGPDNVFHTLVDESYLLSHSQALQPVVYVGHVPYSLPRARIMGAAPKILLGRDPRDLVASYCSSLYYSKVPPDGLMQYIMQNAVPFSEMLGNLITGVESGSISYPDVQTLFTKYYLRWLPIVDLAVRYEDLLPQGDDWACAVQTARAVLTAAGLSLSDEDIRRGLVEGSEPAKSATYHRGQVGRWKELFAVSHITQFKSIAPGLVSALGYELDENWGQGSRLAQPHAPVSGSASLSLTPPAQAGTAMGQAEPVLPSTWLAFPARVNAELESINGRLSRIKSFDDHIHQRVSFLQYAGVDLGFFCWTDDMLHRNLNQTFYDHLLYKNFLADARRHPDPQFIRRKMVETGGSPVYDAVQPRLPVCWTSIVKPSISRPSTRAGPAVWLLTTLRSMGRQTASSSSHWLSIGTIAPPSFTANMVSAEIAAQ